MSKTNDCELKEYYARISDGILCDRKQKKAFLKELKNNIEEFRLSNPQATISDIEAFFGSPEQIAASFTDNTDSVKLKKKLSVKRIVLFAVLLALFVYIAFVVISLIDVHTEAHGYFEEKLLAVIGVLKGVYTL